MGSNPVGVFTPQATERFGIMTQSSASNALKLLALLSMFLLAGCAGSSSYMSDVPPERANYTTQPDQALVVFMRPSGFGFAIQSSVFDIVDENPVFVGIVSAKAKVAYYVNPGERRFMVISESADFMDATLEAGKVYYALVTPRMGVWKARFHCGRSERRTWKAQNSPVGTSRPAGSKIWTRPRLGQVRTWPAFERK